MADHQQNRCRQHRAAAGKHTRIQQLITPAPHSLSELRRFYCMGAAPVLVISIAQDAFAVLGQDNAQYFLIDDAGYALGVRGDYDELFRRALIN